MFGKFTVRRAANPQDTVKAVKNALYCIVVGSTKELRPRKARRGRRHSADPLAKAHAELRRRLDSISRQVVAAIGKRRPAGHSTPETPAEQLTRELFHSEVLLLLIRYLGLLECDARKLVTVIFNNLLEVGGGGDCQPPAVAWLHRQPTILLALVRGYEEATPDSRVYLYTGSMLRRCVHYEELTRLLLQHYDRWMWLFFGYVQMSGFDVATDAFFTFRSLLTRHRRIAAEFLRRDDGSFLLDGFRPLIESSNYVTRRQSLKLLGELLREPLNRPLTERYLGDAANLQAIVATMMTGSPRLQYEAFGVFKLFVGQPHKSAEVQAYLGRHLAALMDFVVGFKVAGLAEEEFHDDRVFVLRQLRRVSAALEARSCLAARQSDSPSPPVRFVTEVAVHEPPRTTKPKSVAFALEEQP